MNEYKVGDIWEAEFVSITPGGIKRYFKHAGEIMIIRSKYVVFEDFEGAGSLVLKKDFKPIKKVKRPEVG